MSKIYKIHWNGSQSDWSLGRQNLWIEFTSANCTRVITEEMDPFMMLEIPMPVDDGYESHDQIDIEINRQLEADFRSANLIGKTIIDQSSDNINESSKAAAATPQVQKSESQETRKLRGGIDRKSSKSKSDYLRELKIYLDHRKERENYLREWRAEEARAFNILNECIGMSGKAMISEFRSSVGENPLGLAKRIWNALVKLNDLNPAYSAAEVIENIVACRVIGRNFAVFCEVFDRLVNSYETKTKSMMQDDLKLGFYLICLKNSELQEELQSALAQFRRQGVPYGELRVKLLEEDSKLRISSRKSKTTTRQVAMLATQNDKQFKDRKDG